MLNRHDLSGPCHGREKMATGNPTVTPTAEISVIYIWIETLVYGANCVMYGLCMFILLRGEKIASLRGVLAMMSTILFLLCTAHVGASLRQLLEAFVYVPADVPDYPTMYWLNNFTGLTVLKNYLNDTLNLAQYIVLVWRLYVVFMCDWRVVVVPIILMVGCVGTIYAVSAVCAHPNVGLYTVVVSSLIKSAWVLDMILNLSVTVAIAGRLWWMGRKNSSMSTGANQYVLPIYVIIESGAIMLITNSLVLAFYASNNPASLSILDVAAQLAALTPFLIVVQVGLTDRYRIPRTSNGHDESLVVLTEEEMTFRVGLSEEQDPEQGIAYSPSL